jgi:hypothetical protein
VRSASKRIRQFLAISALVFLGSVFAFAQLDTGTIRGTLVDPTGAVIPKARIVCVNMNTQNTYIAQTNGEGAYILPSLPVGNYSISASHEGFKGETVNNIHLNVSESHRVDLTLNVGATTEQVTVTADQLQVDSLSQDLGTTIDAQRIGNLPINGRDFTDLLTLVPGSVTSGQFGQTSLGGAETSFAGVNILLDGADATRIDINATSMQLGHESARITRASVDSIAEFHVLQGNYSAEYGRSIGDVVNVVTKSGSNNVHGDVFEFLRNDYVDARNYFATPGSSTPLRLNQFGGNMGGPLVKNKAFLFSNYEGVRQTITNTSIYDVLNTAQRAKFVPAMAPVVAAIPKGNLGADPNDPTDFDLYSANMPNSDREDTGSVRVDWNPRDNAKFYVRYNINDSLTNTTYGPAMGQNAPTPARSQFLKLSNTYIFSPTLLNEVGFGINSNKVESYGGGGNFPVLAVSCFYCNFGVGPGPATFANIRPQTSYQYVDTLTKQWGRQSIKMGADIRHNLSDEELGLQEFLSYGSISDFENNNGFAFSSLGNPMTRIRNTNWDFYVQDDIVLSPRFTVNLGLRYEYNTILHEKNGQLANFDIATQKVGTLGGQLYDPTRTDFGPRIGFSWDPLGHGTTVLRGGFGIFYNPQLTGAVFSLTDNTSSNVSINVFEEPAWGGFFGPSVNCTPGFPLSYPVTYFPVCTPQVRNVDQIDQKMRDTYAEHWSFGIQQQVAKNVVLDVSYAASHGIKLPAGAAFAGLEFNNLNSHTGAFPLSTNYANERELGDFLGSDYYSIQSALRGHHKHLTYDVNYTWSQEFDDAVSVFSAFVNPTNPKPDFSRGDTDLRNNFTADAFYHDSNIPRLPRLLGKGWDVGTIISARTGLPVNIVTNVADDFGSPQRPELLPDASLSNLTSGYNRANHQLNPAIFKMPSPTASDTSTATYQGTSSLGNIPRNAGRGPGFFQADLSFIKHTPILERLNSELRLDLFNIANHPNFANPSANLFTTNSSGAYIVDPNFGRSTTTINNTVGIGTSRQLQVAFKLLF